MLECKGKAEVRVKLVKLTMRLWVKHANNEYKGKMS